MPRFRPFALSIIASILLTSGAWSAEHLFAPDATWNTGERATIGGTEKLISVPLDPGDPNGEHFDLYYFVHLAQKAKQGPVRKTVLFCAGGPGEIVHLSKATDTMADFLSQQGYDVIYFHLRGSGFSQIPPSNQFDRFLRTAYAVKDLEEIRRDYLGPDGKWDAIIGWSYGTVLAQQYASQHSQNVRKLILLGPISRHEFAFDGYKRDVQEIHRHTLERIYELKEFDHVVPEAKRAIVENVFGKLDEPGMLDNIEDAFGSLQFVIDAYCDLKNEGYDLKYSRNFFQQLREIRFVGWFPTATAKNRQVTIGKVIKNELYGIGPTDTDCLREVGNASRRGFYAIGTYDGVNPRFLKEWLSGDAVDIREALRKSGGTAHVANGVNKQIEKVGISNSERIEPWDPGKSIYQHDVPTLVLKGGADPVTAGSQAEFIYSRALTGPRIFIEFPGVGHEFHLPQIPKGTEKFFSGTIRVAPVSIPPGQTRTTIGIPAGLAIDEGLKMELKPPFSAVQQGLRLVAFGVIEEESTEGPDRSISNVIAVIRNEADIDMDWGEMTWSISNSYFTGSVHFDPPKISAGEIRSATGRITEVKLNNERTLQFEPPTLEDDLEFVCKRIGGSDFSAAAGYYLYFKNRNKNKPVDGTPKYWTIKQGLSSRIVEVDPPSLGPGETSSTVVVPGDSNLDLEGEIELVLPKLELGLMIPCISSKMDVGTDVTVRFQNILETQIPTPSPKDLMIRNPSFDVTVKVIPRQPIESKDSVEVPGKFTGLRWKKRLELIRPSELESELEFRGFNILGHDRVSVLLRNNGRNETTADSRSWNFVEPKKSAPCEGGSNSRDCLIFAFLVMEPPDFSNDRENRILNIIRLLFASNNPWESLRVRIEFCKEGICEIGG